MTKLRTSALALVLAAGTAAGVTGCSSKEAPKAKDAWNKATDSTTADNLKKSGALIPGIRPGRAVVEFLPPIDPTIPAEGFLPRLRAEIETHSDRLMAEAGLVVTGEDVKVPYDRFRDRVIFPITDARGRVVAEDVGGARPAVPGAEVVPAHCSL